MSDQFFDIRPNFDFMDFRTDVPVVDFDTKPNFNEEFYVRESSLCVRACKSYIVKLQDLLDTAIRERKQLIDNDEFEYYYWKCMQSFMDLRLFYRNLNKKLL